LGTEQLVRVYNSSSQMIINGSPCYISGSSLNHPNAWYAFADGTGTKFDVAGVATTTISASQFGYLAVSGRVNGLSLNFPVGSQLWLSPTASGSYTSSMPTGSFEKSFIGDIVSSGSGTTTLIVDLHPHAYGAATASFAISASNVLTASNGSRAAASLHFISASFRSRTMNLSASRFGVGVYRFVFGTAQPNNDYIVTTNAWTSSVGVTGPGATMNVTGSVGTVYNQLTSGFSMSFWNSSSAGNNIKGDFLSASISIVNPWA